MYSLYVIALLSHEPNCSNRHFNCMRVFGKVVASLFSYQVLNCLTSSFNPETLMSESFNTSSFALYFPIIFRIGHLCPHYNIRKHLNKSSVAIVCKSFVRRFFNNSLIVLSFNPRFKIVSIIPGMRAAAPNERKLIMGY